MTSLDQAVAQVMGHVSPDLLREIVVGLVDIPSPTGEEAPLAAWAAQHLADAGVEARPQPIDDRQANAVGRVRGAGDGRSLLLYAPIDTLTTGNADEDEPWAADRLRPDMQPVAQVDGDHVIGLGASNPKGHAACVMAATEAIRASGIELAGDLWVGLGAGGMPTNRRARPDLPRENAGQGVGCSFMLEQGIFPDHAVIAKPGGAVAWEEVGLCWFDVTVRGTFSYVGSRHRMPYVNPIVEAGKVVAALEEWFPEYSARHTAGLVAPQGNIGSIRAGYHHMPAVSPASCVLRVDLRTSPDAPPNQVAREFGELIDRVRARHPELQVDWDMVLAIPGTRTPQDDPVVVAAVDAYVAERGRPHEPIVANSGATDANILRGRGVPTARIGMDRIGPDAPLALDFPAGMNVVDVREMERLTRWLVRTALTICR
ncbi:M20 family metallopeptidase [Nocardioides massiliensis]|uniref:Acetylornithine deacetylase/succinyl-diaminopimelate desuccinylase-like protein n=1 Tax=Nocardioides massiliensis TaxID=1325935 RepID=A0ABT9NNC9_9ACTN|nr:peptidase dimerization domain-containing protein [Nocardioides massiliensis]MDP9821821.1 acetylornithine deacetylase/succinyl-diaminopimelate desuccinylase-like protein [Nocardioides massiliensis]